LARCSHLRVCGERREYLLLLPLLLSLYSCEQPECIGEQIVTKNIGVYHYEHKVKKKTKLVFYICIF
jgi:hypothetical protein